MRKKKIKIPIYIGTLIIVSGRSMKKLCKKYDIATDEYGFDAMVLRKPTKNGHTQYLALFEGKPTNRVIVHEAVHLVNMIFQDRGISLDVQNDEPQAYLTDWVFNQIKKAVK